MFFFFRSAFFYILICAFLHVVGVYAGTLEDIQAKTGWETAVHSQRENAFLSMVTPAELIANLDKYHRNTVQMQVLFAKMTTQGLNKWIGPKRNRHMWPSKRYDAFRIKDPQNKVRSSNIYLFLDKNSSYEEILLSLTPGTKITVTGLVKDIDKGKAWLEAKKIDLGWER